MRCCTTWHTVPMRTQATSALPTLQSNHCCGPPCPCTRGTPPFGENNARPCCTFVHNHLIAVSTCAMNRGSSRSCVVGKPGIPPLIHCWPHSKMLQSSSQHGSHFCLTCFWHALGKESWITRHGHDGRLRKPTNPNLFEVWCNPSQMHDVWLDPAF